MKKKTVLILVNIAAFVFALFSLWNILGGDVGDFCNVAIPSSILFGSHLYCLTRVTKNDP